MISVARMVALACEPRSRSLDLNGGSFAIWIAWVHDLERDIRRKKKEKKERKLIINGVVGSLTSMEDRSNCNRPVAISRQHVAFVPFLALFSLLGFLFLFLYSTYILSDK